MARGRSYKRDSKGRFARVAGSFRAAARSRKSARVARKKARRAAIQREFRAQERASWGIYGSEAAFDRAAETYERGGGGYAFRKAHEAQVETWRRG